MVVVRTDAIVAPGIRVDQRYRLDRQLGGSDGSSVWRGTDELLRRSVALQVFDPDSGRVSEIFEAVSRASRITHRGLAQVFDANADAGPPYLVREWLGGRDLRSVLADGPLDPPYAVEAFRQAGEAIAVAHDAGVYHQRLTARSIVWGTTGRVKIVGLGVDAALIGVRVDDPQRADTRALARLLRIAVSGRWWHGVGVTRPAAGQAMRAWVARHRGIGRELASVANRALADGPRAIRTPDRFAAELARIGFDRAAVAGTGSSRLAGPEATSVRRRMPVSRLAVPTRPIPRVRTRSERRGAAA